MKWFIRVNLFMCVLCLFMALTSNWLRNPALMTAAQSKFWWDIEHVYGQSLMLVMTQVFVVMFMVMSAKRI